VGKAQKLEPLGLVTLTRGTAEVQQPLLGLLKLETVAAKALGQYLVDPPGVVPILKDDDKVSSPGESHPQALTGRVEDWRGT